MVKCRRQPVLAFYCDPVLFVVSPSSLIPERVVLRERRLRAHQYAFCPLHSCFSFHWEGGQPRDLTAVFQRLWRIVYYGQGSILCFRTAKVVAVAGVDVGDLATLWRLSRRIGLKTPRACGCRAS